MIRRNALLAVALLGLAACASPTVGAPGVDAAAVMDEQAFQLSLVLGRQLEEERRIREVGARVLAANLDACEKTAPYVGFVAHQLEDYPRKLRPAAIKHYLIEPGAARVKLVDAGSPAASAGLVAGDRLVAVNGRTVPGGQGAANKAVELVIEAAQNGYVDLALERNGAPVDLRITPAITCGYPVVMGPNDVANAYADGQRIVVERGLLRYVRDDDELALVIAHELAHNARGHVDAKRQNAMMGGVGGLLLDVAAAAAGVNTGGVFTDAGMNLGAIAYSTAFESEADYVGMYYLARAGYDLTDVEDFWRRMATEDPNSVVQARTHPTTAERFLKLQAAREEIQARRAAGLPLTPQVR